MTLNDLIRQASAISGQLASGDIPLTQDIELELKELGDNYVVEVIPK